MLAHVPVNRPFFGGKGFYEKPLSLQCFAKGKRTVCKRADNFCLVSTGLFLNAVFEPDIKSRQTNLVLMNDLTQYECMSI